MNIALFGGTFNPVHNGHIKLILQLKAEYHIDKVIVMPTKKPPHKPSVDLADDNDRLNMLKLAFDGYEGFEVSDYEIKNTEISYSYDTLVYLKTVYPHDKLFLVMGGDMLLYFTKWNRYKDIFPMVTIIAASREKGEYEKLLDEAEKLKEFSSEIYISESEPFVISSTKIREYVRNNQSYSCYLPNKVVQYISENNLYNR